MPIRSRSALSLALVFAAAAAVLVACVGDEEEDPTETAIQKVGKCKVTRDYHGVPVLAPAPGICVLDQDIGQTHCPLDWKIRPVNVKCKNFCNRGAISCSWFDFSGVERAIEEPRREPDLETWTPCNGINSCDGYLPDPNML